MSIPHVADDVGCRELPPALKMVLGHSKLPQATVLVVDDDSDLRRVMCLVLRECGCKTLSAANGLEALLTCQCHEDPIDLVISDVVMPHLSGWELSTRLRRSYPAIKVLMISAYDQLDGDYVGPIIPRDKVECSVDFLRKPFSIFTLSDKVREILQA